VMYIPAMVDQPEPNWALDYQDYRSSSEHPLTSL